MTQRLTRGKIKEALGLGMGLGMEWEWPGAPSLPLEAGAAARSPYEGGTPASGESNAAARRRSRAAAEVGVDDGLGPRPGCAAPGSIN